MKRSPKRFLIRKSFLTAFMAFIWTCRFFTPEAAVADSHDTPYTLTIDDFHFADSLVPRLANSCASLDILPTAFLRETYFHRDQSIACSRSASHILEIMEISIDLFAGRGQGSSMAADMAKSYAEFCLDSFASVSDADENDGDTSNIVGYLSSEEEVAVLRNSLGVLSTENQHGSCAATILDVGNNRSGLLTAMHCLGQLRRVNGAADQLQITVPHSVIRFESISGDSMAFRLPSEIVGIPFDENSQDVVLIDIPKVGESLLELTTVTPELWEPIFLAGFNPFLAGTAVDESVEWTDVGQAVAFSVDPFCRVTYIGENGEIGHICQTIARASGALMLVLRDGRFLPFGVHNGANDAGLGCGNGFVPSINRGVAIGSLE